VGNDPDTPVTVRTEADEPLKVEEVAP